VSVVSNLDYDRRRSESKLVELRAREEHEADFKAGLPWVPKRAEEYFPTEDRNVVKRVNSFKVRFDICCVLAPR
jgi:hypothetical protein